MGRHREIIRLSTGKLFWPEGFQAQRTAVEPSTIRVSWLKDAHLGGNTLKDELMVIWEADGLYSEITGTGMVRMALGGSFELPELPKDASHIYLFFASKDRRNYSESVCFEV